MKKIAISLVVLTLASSPLRADEEGFSLMEEGAKLFFKGILQEMEPTMQDLRGLAEDMEPALRQFVDQMGPALADLMGKIDDISAYHPPEMMPNGDIIMRKKSPQELATPESGDVEL
jgi:hypothetical protein